MTPIDCSSRHGMGDDPTRGDATGHRSRSGGSLIERAADAFPFAPRPLSSAAMDDPARAPQEVEAPAGTPRDATAIVPLRAPASHRRGTVDRAALAENGLLDPTAAPGLLAEEFRAIKRPILLDGFGARGHDAADRGRMVLVGSPRPGDGKSFCAANLALSLASEKDIAVLLVDADFAKPSVPRLLGLETDGQGGLLDALRDRTADVEGWIVDTDVPGLSVLPAGTPGRDDTELLTSNRAAAVLDRLMATDPRRMIVFDTPPVLVASPARVLATHVGQILLVVRADRTREQDVSDAVEAFGGEAKLHLMLNAVSFTAGGSRFGSYYGYGDAT